jgi:hypothetical protein
MPLLSQMFRSQAIYGDTDTFLARVAGRQGGQWARRTVEGAMPHPPSAPHPRSMPRRPSTDATLADLHRRGLVTDAELASLRARHRPGA